MRKNKLGCGACDRKVCTCRRPRPVTSTCICPPGPRGPQGPQGLPGAPGSTIFTGGDSIEKWSGLLTPTAALVLLPDEDLPAGTPFTVGASTYLADAVLGGLVAGVDTVTGLGIGSLAIPPSYPSTPDGITFDSLSVTFKTAIGTAITLPDGAELVAQLVVNAGRPDERVCLEAVVEQTDPLAGITIPLIGVSDPLYATSAAGTCYVAPEETYDVRVGIRNPTNVNLAPLSVALGASIQAAVTARVIDA